MLVEAERLRPHLEELLAEADYVSTSAKFPQVRYIIPTDHENFLHIALALALILLSSHSVWTS